MKSTRVLAVDLGAAHVGCAVFRRTGNAGLRLEQCAVEQIDSDPAGDAGWCVAAERAWRAAMARIAHRGEGRVAIPGHLALTKSVRTPAIAVPGRQRVAAFEAAQGIPYPLDEVWWDHLVQPADGGDLELLLMAVRREEMAAVCAAATAAGCRLACATPTAVALHRAFWFSYPEPQEPVLLASVGARSTHLLVCTGARFWARTVPLGGRDVTQAIAAGLNIGFAAAESVKLAAGDEAAAANLSATERDTAMAAEESFSRRLHLEMARSLAALPEPALRAEVRQILLTGGASRSPRLAAALHAKFGVPVERFSTCRRVEDALRGSDGAELDALGPLIGLAAGDPVQGRGLGNVLPPPVVRAAAWRRRRRVLLALAAVAVLGTTSVAVHFHRQAVGIAAEVDTESTRVKALRSVAERHAVLQQRLEAIRAERAALERLADERTFWARLLADLEQRVMSIDGAWLDEFAPASGSPERSVSSDGADGTAPLRLAIAGRLVEMESAAAGRAANRVRARALLAALAASPFVAGVEEERFDNRAPGLLRFTCRIVIKRPDSAARR